MLKNGLETIKVIVVMILFIALVIVCGYSESHYYRTGFIHHTNTPYKYTFTDSTGNMWEFVDYDILIPYNTSVKANVKMYTHGSDTIYDDEILDIEILSVSKNKK